MDRVIKQHDSQDIGGGLRWCESLGLAFQADMSRSVPYDDAYFDRHAGYMGTPISDRIQAARINLVDSCPCVSPDCVLDIGIGSGTFLEAYAELGQLEVGGGYDVNPRAVAWLEERSWLVDPWSDDLRFGWSEHGLRVCWTLWDVLEHLRNPHELLDLIREGDTLCLTVPVFHDLRREVFKSKHFRPDEHYYYFTSAGLIRWLWSYRFELLTVTRDEQLAGRESVASFAFRKVAPLCLPDPGKRAFIVCGPESSGNRLLTAILCRAGAWGTGSTDQPQIQDIPDTEPTVALIRHHDVLATYRALTKRGFSVTALLTVREWTANASSLVQRGHDVSRPAAESRICKTLLSNLCDCVTYHIPTIVTTYESLGDQAALSHLLRRLQLRQDNLHAPLNLRGQEYPEQTFFPQPLDANSKHYG